MRERPIIFSGPTVRAILEGRKAETRRLLGGELPSCPDYGPNCSDLRFERCQWVNEDAWTDGWTGYRRCQYGRPGDLLWVREAWRLAKINGDSPGSFIDVQFRAGYGVLGYRRDWREFYADLSRAERWSASTLIEEFGHLWDSINGRRATWESNPWVFVIKFEKVTDRKGVS